MFTNNLIMLLYVSNPRRRQFPSLKFYLYSDYLQMNIIIQTRFANEFLLSSSYTCDRELRETACHASIYHFVDTIGIVILNVLTKLPSYAADAFSSTCDCGVTSYQFTIDLGYHFLFFIIDDKHYLVINFLKLIDLSIVTRDRYTCFFFFFLYLPFSYILRKFF